MQVGPSSVELLLHLGRVDESRARYLQGQARCDGMGGS